MGLRKFTKEIIEEELKKRGYYPIEEVKEDMKAKVSCEDREGFKYEVYPLGLIKMNAKPKKISKDNKFSLENIKKILKQKKSVLTLKEGQVFKSSATKMDFICLNCGKKNEKSWDHLSNVIVCSYCSKVPHIITKETSLAGKRPDLIKYFVNKKEAEKVSEKSGKKVKLKCPDCGFEKEMEVERLASRGFSCGKCSDGIPIGEKAIAGVLTDLKIDFKREKTFEWSKGYRYDFYLEKEKMIIETHGLQHYKEKSGFFKKTLSEQQKIDKEKKELALKNGIKKYVEINCSTITIESIKKETIKELGQHLDLSKVDWKKAMTNTRNSIMVEICNYYKENKGMKIKEIIENLPYSKSSVLKYLKIGAELGLCDYKRTLNQHGKIWTKKE